MLRTWLAILMVMVLLGGCAGAEGSFSSASYDRALAVVDGEVFCAGLNAGLGFIPIYRIGSDGLEGVCSRIGGWNNLYDLDNQLLTVEPVLNIGEMLGSIPTSTYKAKLLDPATKQSSNFAEYVWNTGNGVCNIFAAQNKAYRDVRSGDQHTLERLDGDEWVVVAAWTGDRAWTYESYCVIGDRNADRPEYVALYEFATGKTYDVTALLGGRQRWFMMAGVLEDGVFYRLELDGLIAIHLDDGRTEMLVPLPDGMDAFILTDEELILMSHQHQQAWVLDRKGWEIVRQAKMTGYPQNAALSGGKLYVYSVYGDDAGVEVIDLAGGKSVWYSLK